MRLNVSLPGSAQLAMWLHRAPPTTAKKLAERSPGIAQLTGTCPDWGSLPNRALSISPCPQWEQTTAAHRPVRVALALGVDTLQPDAPFENIAPQMA